MHIIVRRDIRAIVAAPRKPQRGKGTAKVTKVIQMKLEVIVAALPTPGCELLLSTSFWPLKDPVVVEHTILSTCIPRDPTDDFAPTVLVYVAPHDVKEHEFDAVVAKYESGCWWVRE